MVRRISFIFEYIDPPSSSVTLEYCLIGVFKRMNDGGTYLFFNEREDYETTKMRKYFAPFSAGLVTFRVEDDRKTVPLMRCDIAVLAPLEGCETFARLSLFRKISANCEHSK